ncbi:sterol 26-hydroxylase, mitochondrial isoform X1 [Synchiropus splendidus]|uniref:sterol 26-hydroxylase, mitochondrial isoform X1 n=1 Tax=Synchiropus splendidus TaxID=270530 RepID=UPI00237DDE18|nr:sterol 26-hydroxylase, mitochondrial isoform X1 [Synchiropus splendidus]
MSFMASGICQVMMKRSGGLLPLYSSSASQVISRWTHTTSSSGVSGVEPRTVQDLPRCSFLTLLYRMFFKGYYKCFHELQIYETKLYGPIYRDGLMAVCLSTPQLVEELLRNEEKYPSRGDMSFWKEYRDMRGYGYGPFTEEGEEWHNLRVLLSKQILHPKDAAQYGCIINKVVSDFVTRICYLRQRSPTGDLVTDMANELYGFSLEGISAILFETRIGCLEREIPPGTQEFINSIAQMFSNSLAVIMMPKWSRSLFPFWHRYIDGWEGIFSFAKKLIDKKLEAIRHSIDNNQDVQGEYLTYLLAKTDMSTKDVYGSIAELLLAGVDTTSNTLMWTMHLLSKHPEVQERLYQEVSSTIPPDSTLSAEQVTRMPYLRAVVKEVLRMYPVVTMNGRTLYEKDVVVGGYYFPKKTSFKLCHYAISHDEETFPEPFVFRPERWLRTGKDRPNPFGSIPFGFGVRSCVGRRIAELEMYMALIQLIRLFEIKPDPTVGEVKCLDRTVLVADRPVNFHFVERR